LSQSGTPSFKLWAVFSSFISHNLFPDLVAVSILFSKSIFLFLALSVTERRLYQRCVAWSNCLGAEKIIGIPWGKTSLETNASREQKQLKRGIEHDNCAGFAKHAGSWQAVLPGHGKPMPLWMKRHCPRTLPGCRIHRAAEVFSKGSAVARSHQSGSAWVGGFCA